MKYMAGISKKSNFLFSLSFFALIPQCVSVLLKHRLSLSLMADWAGVSPVSSITQRPTEHALQSADLLPCLSPWWLLLSWATYFAKTAFCSSLYWKHQAKPITGINRPVISRNVSLFVCVCLLEGGGSCFDLSNPSYKLTQKKKDSEGNHWK